VLSKSNQAGGIDSRNAGEIDDHRVDVAVDQGDGFEGLLSGTKEERARNVVADNRGQLGSGGVTTSALPAL